MARHPDASHLDVAPNTGVNAQILGGSRLSSEKIGPLRSKGNYRRVAMIGSLMAIATRLRRTASTPPRRLFSAQLLLRIGEGLLRDVDAIGDA